MVDAAKADIIGPSVTAKRPDRLLGQILLIVQNKFHIRGLCAGFQCGNERIGDLTGLFLVVPIGQITVDGVHSHAGIFHSFQMSEDLPADGVLRMEEPIGKLRIVLKQGMLPGGAKATAVTAVGQNGRSAAVSGRAARGVADIHAVAHQLADQLDVGGLGAACACGRELEVRLCELDILDRFAADDILFQIGFIHGDLVEVALLRLHLLKGRHDQRLLGRAYRQAHATA
ncbi:hypothetical protein SDC9_153837 [bioreactor metagenome]|uniref:Uncharacterized protein n=1 Tax=bioreactor metagenome TaxID=1076179 RepID=A0A645EX34_9ZZZZ